MDDRCSSVFEADSPLVTRLHQAVNVEPRRNGLTPTILLMHYTGMACVERAIYWLSCEESKVSCHYVIDEAGGVTQLVSEAERAWHAGQSYWSGLTDVNSASIGIEIHNRGHNDGYDDFPAEQMNAVLALSQDILRRNNIPPQRVLAHSDIAPGRKIDPGEKFDWRWLHENGVGHWVEPEPVIETELGYDLGTANDEILETQEKLQLYGYGLQVTGVFDEDTKRIVTAFQRHFRPMRLDGRIDRSTILTLDRLIAALQNEPHVVG
ncbi:MAG: N-acetylmuramoyl-L-alanine amidase [Hyphomicrobiaceae bacterium]